MAGSQALACIVDKLCGFGAPSYVPGDPTATAFNEGRRAVAIAIRQILATDINEFPEVDHGRR